MKKPLLIFGLSLMVSLGLNAQNQYQVNTSATNINTQNSATWVPTLTYSSLKSGLRFMVLPAVKGSAYELDFKTKNDSKPLLLKDFAGKIFTYKKWTDISQTNGDIKRRFYFDCDGKEYFLEIYKPDNEEKTVNWKTSSIVWLEEIDAVKKKLEGKTFWLNADEWKYEINGKTAYTNSTERYAKVTVLQVGAGNYSNQPVRVLFRNEKDQKQYFLDGCVSGSWGSCFLSSGRLQDWFSTEAPETKYPKVQKAFWAAIKNRKVKTGMTEEETLLSLGKPNNRESYNKGKDKFVVLNYQPTDPKPYYLSILLKNNKVAEINKSE